MTVRPRKRNVLHGLVAGVGMMLLAALVWWLLHDPVSAFKRSEPGMDQAVTAGAAKAEEVKIGEKFTRMATAAETPGPGWPRFRGEAMDNVSHETVPLADRLDDLPGRIRWRIDLGEGHAAPAIYKGLVYLLDYDEKERTDALRCFSLLTGQELWRREYRVRLKRNHGLSRTIPAVNEKIAVTIGPKCQVMCVDRLTGDLKWGLDMVKQFNTEVPFWYTGQCPLLAGDTLILAPAGKALMAAIDGNTGATLWETPNPRQWKMSHSSVVRALIDGKAMYIYFAIGGIAGVSAAGEDTGKLLWECETFAPAVVAPTPVVLEQGMILLTAGYGAGTAMLQVKRNGTRWTAAVVEQFRPQEGIASEQQTPVAIHGMIYGIQPKDAGGAREQFVGVKPGNVKEFLVSSGKETRFGLGPYLAAGGYFYILNDDGMLTIASVKGNRFTVSDTARILGGQDAWGPMALAGGYLLARDSKQIVCIDIRKR